MIADPTFEFVISGAYEVRPATLDDVIWAVRLANQVYDQLDVMPESVMLRWFQMNQTGFSTLWHNGERAGNFDILPLKQPFLDHFLTGKMLERDLPPESLYTREESSHIRHLYWESVVIDPKFKGSPTRMLKTLTEGFPTVFGRVCPLRQIEKCYAISASLRGTNVVRRLGFSPLGHPDQRLDAHQLYQVTLSELTTAITRLFGDQHRRSQSGSRQKSNGTA